MLPVLLLLGSNVFMTFAWYGHLKYKSAPLALAIFASWGIAFFEYCLMVPANRLGQRACIRRRSSRACRRSSRCWCSPASRPGTSDQPLKWNHWAGFALIAAAAWLIFLD